MDVLRAWLILTSMFVGGAGVRSLAYANNSVTVSECVSHHLAPDSVRIPLSTPAVTASFKALATASATRLVTPVEQWAVKTYIGHDGILFPRPIGNAHFNVTLNNIWNQADRLLSGGSIPKLIDLTSERFKADSASSAESTIIKFIAASMGSAEDNPVGYQKQLPGMIDSIYRRYSKFPETESLLKATEDMVRKLLPDYLAAVKADLEEQKAGLSESACQSLVPASTAVAVCKPQGRLSRMALFGHKKVPIPTLAPLPPSTRFYDEFVDRVREQYGVNESTATGPDAGWKKFAEQGDDLHRQLIALLPEAQSGDELATADMVKLNAQRLFNINLMLRHYQDLNLPNGQSLQTLLATDLSRSPESKRLVRELGASTELKISRINAIRSELGQMLKDSHAIDSIVAQSQGVSGSSASLRFSTLAILNQGNQTQIEGMIQTMGLTQQVIDNLQKIDDIARLKYVEDATQISSNSNAAQELDAATKQLHALLATPQEAILVRGR